MSTENPTVEGIGKIAYNRLWCFIDIATAVLVNEHNDEGGGHFNLRSPSGDVLFDTFFRSPAEEKAEKYAFFAAEKTERLWKHPEHILSWESRNEECEQYQGAVRAPNSLFGGFSGFTAKEDEALVLWVFMKMGWLDGKEAYTAAQISANSRYAVLVPRFNQAEKTSD